MAITVATLEMVVVIMVEVPMVLLMGMVLLRMMIKVVRLNMAMVAVL